MGPLADYLGKAALGPVTLVGWSLGGYAAVEFARAHPELVAQARACRRQAVISRRRNRLHSETRCSRTESAASGDSIGSAFCRRTPGEYRTFREGLMRSYMTEMSMQELLEGLDYLAAQEITPAALPDCPVTLVHGGRDPIAPPVEARGIMDGAPSAKLVMIPHAGHAAWLADEFASVVDDV